MEMTYDRTVYTARHWVDDLLSAAENLGVMVIKDDDYCRGGILYHVDSFPFDLTFYNHTRTKEKSLMFNDYRSASFIIYCIDEKDDFVKVELFGTKLHQHRRAKK